MSWCVRDHSIDREPADTETHYSAAARTGVPIIVNGLDELEVVYELHPEYRDGSGGPRLSIGGTGSGHVLDFVASEVDAFVRAIVDAAAKLEATQ